jgi:hypothetical protein
MAGSAGTPAMRRIYFSLSPSVLPVFLLTRCTRAHAGQVDGLILIGAVGPGRFVEPYLHGCACLRPEKETSNPHHGAQAVLGALICLKKIGGGGVQ